MFTTGSKFFYGVGFLLVAAALGYAWTTGGNGLGPLTFGYKGSVGDHFGFFVLMASAGCAFFLGLTANAFRDADAEAAAEYVGVTVPPAVAPASPSYWPVVAAFGVGAGVLGLVISNVLFVVGCFVVGAAAIEWLVLAWSERATGDPESNRAIRNRIMYPFEIPLAGALAVLGLVVSISRVLLAVSSEGAVWVALAVAVVVLGLGALIASRPKLSANLIAMLLVIGGIATLTAGVIGASVGERDFHHHETETTHEGEKG